MIFFLYAEFYCCYLFPPINALPSLNFNWNNILSELSLFVALLIILLTLFVVLLERKFLAYAQRRMGPAIMGRNGVFQLALDLLKLMTKETFLIPRPSSSLAPIILAFLYATQVLFSQNFIFQTNLTIFLNVDSLILYHLILTLLANIFFALVGFLSHSRYAFLGTYRSLVHVISLDIFITMLYALLIFLSQSPHFHDWVLSQISFWYCFLLFPLFSIFLVVLILESKRAPFDHAETESEMVAGYAVEYNGSMLLIFYLAEYSHLVIAAAHIILFFFGGWNTLPLFSLLPPLWFTPSTFFF
uniref:NADH dehydrogenase subunit 1-a n=1 Tax=Bakuella subtropica TaxID=1295181 RepID=UPI0023F1290C|nr:NADH dehydrogenase subunit 1-a [Bakuella subtropica]WDY80868.1 NADH dehydrogenase subunit 1-a [Bakuella subtropica]